MRLALLFLVAALAGCAGIPNEALKSYTDAFSKVQGASDDFLIQYGQTIKNANAFQARLSGGSVAVRSYPRSLSSGGDSDLDRNVETMRLGFQVIANYNASLVALAEGKSDQAIASSVKGLASAIASFVPVAGTLAGPISVLATELEKARRAEEFRKALKDGAPKVRQILSLIAANVDSNYDIQSNLADNVGTTLGGNVVARIGKLAKLMAGHQAPAAGSGFPSLEKRQAQLDSAVQPLTVLDQFKAQYPFQLAFGGAGGTSAYTASTDAIVESVMSDIKAQVAKFQSLDETMNALAKSSESYKQMLSIAIASISKLEAAGATPPDLAGQASDLLRLAFLVKAQIEAVRSASLGTK